jgi:uncharacterized NAD(P)/FAD-binding protein YdhS
VTFTFGVIGGGLTGTSMLCQLVPALRRAIRPGRLRRPSVEIVVIEKQRVFGPGFPHSAHNALPLHLINMCAQDMSILADRPQDFVDWVETERGSLSALYPEAFATPDHFGGRCSYHPRVVMGRYLMARFDAAVGEARELGVGVRLLPGHEATDLEDGQHGVVLHVTDLASGHAFALRVDRALLATGHWRPAEPDGGRFLWPWPAARLLESIPAGESVAIIGTGLTAVDTALTLSSRGSFVADGALRYVPPADPVTMTLYSRNGMLPRVRGSSGGYQNRFFTRHEIDGLIARHPDGVPLQELFRLLDADLEAAYGHSIDWGDVLAPRAAPLDVLREYLRQARVGDGPDGELLWQTVFHQTLGMARDVYLHLTLADRVRFEHSFGRVFQACVSPMSITVAERLLALMEAGVVEVTRLGHDPLPQSYTYVVDARGQPLAFETDGSTLARNLLGRGTVQVEGAGGLWIDPATFRVLQRAADGSVIPSQRVYAVGAMTRGQIIDTSSASASVLSTSRIVEEIEAVLSSA